MTRLTSEELVLIAKALNLEFNRRVYFHIPAGYEVERSNLKFSHIHVFEKDDHPFHLPIYTFNNRLYIHSAFLYPLGEGQKVGAIDSTGAHYYPPEV